MSWRVMQAMDDDFRSMQRAVHFEIKKWPRARAVGRHWEPGAISMTAAVAWPCFAPRKLRAERHSCWHGHRHGPKRVCWGACALIVRSCPWQWGSQWGLPLPVHFFAKKIHRAPLFRQRVRGHGSSAPARALRAFLYSLFTVFIFEEKKSFFHRKIPRRKRRRRKTPARSAPFTGVRETGLL